MITLEICQVLVNSARQDMLHLPFHMMTVMIRLRHRIEFVIYGIYNILLSLLISFRHIDYRMNLSFKSWSLSMIPIFHGNPIAAQITIARAFYFLTLSSGIIYMLFQKKVFPKSIAKIVSQIYFYPTFPFTALRRIGNYWTPVDKTLILGKLITFSSQGINISVS